MCFDQRTIGNYKISLTIYALLSESIKCISNLILISSDFELEEFKLSRFYCSNFFILSVCYLVKLLYTVKPVKNGHSQKTEN